MDQPFVDKVCSEAGIQCSEMHALTKMAKICQNGQICKYLLILMKFCQICLFFFFFFFSLLFLALVGFLFFLFIFCKFFFFFFFFFAIHFWT